MKKIKIKFVDFWKGFNYEESDFYKILEKRYIVEISDEPEFIIYSVFGDEYLEYDCIKIFYTGENVIPDFNLCDYAIGFCYLEYGHRYLRMPLYTLLNCKKYFEKAIIIHKIEITKREKFCNFIYSNKNADKEREEFYNLLSKYKKVDSGGKYLNNIGGAVEDKFLFQQKYKFSIAFENTSSEGYITEKLIEAKAAGTIPIYWGNPKVDKEFNANSFINCHKYKNFDEVVEEIKKIDVDEELYRKYMKEPFVSNENIIEENLKKLEEFLIYIIEHKKIERPQNKTTLNFTSYNKLNSYKKLMKNKIAKKIIKRWFR